MIEVMSGECKISKSKINKLVVDEAGQLYGLYGCIPQAIGLFKITKELKGHFCRCTHEYWKEGHFSKVAST